MTEGKYISKNRIFALIWRIVIFAGCVWGLIPMFFGKAASAKSLCYFTIQSNIIILVLFAVLAAGTLSELIKSGAHGEVYGIKPGLQLWGIFTVQITFSVYAVLLSGSMFKMGQGIAITNLLLHYVVPIMALLDWVLFMPHGRVPYKDAALWLIYPAAYVVFSFIRADLGTPFADGSRFPYFFMDMDKLGWNLLWICPLFFAVYFLLGAIIVTADKLIGKKPSK